MERERGQPWCAMEDCSTDERLQQEMLSRRQWTDEYIKRPETLMRLNVVVVWLECLQVDVVRHAGTLAPTVLTFVHQNSDLVGDAFPKSSRESETVIDWRTGLDTDRQILCRWCTMAKQEDTVFPIIIIIIIIIRRRFLMRRNTTDKSLQGHASTQWLMTCHTNHTVSRHISARSCQWWRGKTSMRL